MHILIIGAAGMVGRKLTARLVADGSLAGRQITVLSLLDVVRPDLPAGAPGRVSADAADLSAPGAAAHAIAARPDVIFHLAAIVSGEAEADFDKGYRINLDGTRAAVRGDPPAGPQAAYSRALVFTSSIAVFGAPFPDAIDDDFFRTPLTSYGTQKAIGELLLADYSRRGFFDGIGIRLPTICVRPGTPNKAASGFFSNILREPLAGQEAVLPVAEDVRHWHASPRAAVAFLLHAASLDLTKLGARRNLEHAGPFGDRRRADRGPAPRRRRGGGAPDPPRAGPGDRADRRRLAAQFRRPPRRGARLPRGKDLRRDHPRPCRGRAGRPAALRRGAACC